MSLQPVLFQPPPMVRPSFKLGPAEVALRNSRQILARGVGRTEAYDFTLNPYVGCQFGCSYCYAAAFVPDEVRRRDWGQWVEVKENALQLLRQRRDLAGKTIYLGSATDPYQPVESRTRLTRRILEYLATLSPQPRIVIQTRSPLVTRDIDVLLRFSRLRVNVSVTTDDDEVRRSFEPNAPTISARLAALRELRAAGLRTGCCLAPLLPVRDVTAFAKTLKELGAERYGVSFLHAPREGFAAGSREAGLKLAQAVGWNLQSYRRTVARLHEQLPELLFGPRVFEPE